MYSLLWNTIVDESKRFIIDSKSIDLKLDEITYNLIEKK
jgi:hypothetical protein